MAVFDRRCFLKQTIVAGAGFSAVHGFDGSAYASPTEGRNPELQQVGEWTFEDAKKVWKPMTRAVQHVGVPGFQWKGGVLWDGSLVFGPYRNSAPRQPRLRDVNRSALTN
jgi:hypothetical protein